MKPFKDGSRPWWEDEYKRVKKPTPKEQARTIEVLIQSTRTDGLVIKPVRDLFEWRRVEGDKVRIITVGKGHPDGGLDELKRLVDVDSPVPVPKAEIGQVWRTMRGNDEIAGQVTGVGMDRDCSMVFILGAWSQYALLQDDQLIAGPGSPWSPAVDDEV